MSKTIVVGDVHGKLHVVEAILKLNSPTVFVGDILDAYEHTTGEQVQCLELIIDAMLDTNRDVHCTMGNHDLQYLDPSMRCSGFHSQTQYALMSDFHGKTLMRHISDMFSPYIYAEGFLISHAGVSNKLLKYLDITIDEYLCDGQFKDIGYSRGGHSPVGGLYWCDWYDEFEYVPGVPQIVGHSRPRGGDDDIRCKGNSYCIDALDNGSHDDGFTVGEIENGYFASRKIYI